MTRWVCMMTAALGLLPRLLMADEGLEEVIVTAQKREQNLQDVSIAVSALSGDALRKLGVTTASDIAGHVSGVQVNMEYGNAPTFTIRGINVNDYYVTTTPAAAVYVDGVYRATSVNSGEHLYDIDRVEVLKGPQGTLYGRNTTGGAVSIVTRRPTDKPEAYVEGEYGSFDRAVLSGAVSGPLFGSVRGRLAFQWQNDNGAFDNRQLDGQPAPAPYIANPRLSPAPPGVLSSSANELGALDYRSVRGQLLINPGEDVEVLFVAHYSADRGRNAPVTILGASGPQCGVIVDPASGVPIGGTFDPARCTDAFGYSDPKPFDHVLSNDFTPRKDIDIYGAGVTANWNTGWGRIVSITGYEGFERREGIDADGSPRQLITGFYHQKHDQYSEELRLEGERDRFQYTLGAFASHDETRSADPSRGENSLNVLLGLAPLNTLLSDIDQKTLHLAVFGQTEWSFAERLKLISGLRLSYEDKDNLHIDRLGFIPGALPLPVLPGLGEQGVVSASSELPGAPNSRLSRNVSYRLGLDWKPVDDLLLYVSHTRGIKSGGFDNTVLFDQASLSEFDDEVLKAYEAGMKWSASRSFRLNGALYYYDYQKPQQRKGVIVNNVPRQLLVNLDSADLYGLEFDATWLPLAGLQVEATATFLHSKTHDSEDPLLNDKHLPFAPDFSGTLTTRYEHPLTDRLSWAAQADFKYTGKHYPDAYNIFMEEEEYRQFGARLSLTDTSGAWEVSLWGRNLSNDIYILNSFAAVGSRGIYLSEPRSYGVSARLRML